MSFLKNVILLSLPKSGRTWLLCLLATMINEKIPTMTSDGFLKSHGLQYTHEFGTTKTSSAQKLKKWLCHDKKHVILIERDPRDQIISSFYEHRYRNWMWRKRILRGNLTDNLSYLISETKDYNERITFALANLPCREHNLHVIRYETLIACTECVVEWLIENITGKIYHANHAAAMCEFDRLIKMNGTGKWGKSIPYEPNSNKFRSGTVGNWREFVPHMNSLFKAKLYLKQQIERERKYGIFSKLIKSVEV
mgnify:CR=1 FL=1|tara:strand:+ start:147 stop:902 length:756 start_codon:yes stop_codon:yes gene_type:complete